MDEKKNLEWLQSKWKEIKHGTHPFETEIKISRNKINYVWVFAL